MNTFTIIAIATVALLVVIGLASYISVLIDDRRYYKMLAERWEEAYFEGYETEGHNDPQGVSGHMAYFAELNESQHDVMNGIDKHLY